MTDFITLDIREDIAYLIIDCVDDSVNTLSPAMTGAMSDVLDTLENANNVTGAVVCSAKKDFIVGFDIKELKRFGDDEKGLRTLVLDGQKVFKRFDALGIPIVAAIHGNCLGGGLEVALACHGRVASNDKRTKMGLPEVMLGVYPGGGGTQRLPNVVDLQVALDMILTGKNINARKAKKIGLVDDVVHEGILLDVAADLVRKLAKTHGKRGGVELGDVISDPTGQAMKFVASSPARGLIFNKARETVLEKTGGHYPAPLKALDAIEAGVAKGPKKGYAAEAEGFVELVTSPVAQNLINLFFMKQEADKDPVVGKRTKPIETPKIGVLGAGLMGAGITQVLANKGYDVRLKDRDLKGLGWGLDYCQTLFDKAVKYKKMSSPEADIAMGRISGTTDYSGLKTSNFIIEAVFEDLSLKQTILAELESLGNENQIFASNTSTLPIAEIAAKSKRPENVIGMHFFSPVHKMPLLEIIKTKKTSAATIATTLKIGREMGKTCIVVNDGPGFFTSRVVGAYINEAGWILQEGGAIDAIDKAMVSWGFPVGPMKLVDEVGLDVALKAAGVLKNAFSERWEEPKSLTALAAEGRKGRKNSSGLYLYGEHKGKVVDPSVYPLIKGWRAREFDVSVIQKRIWLAMLNECAYSLQEGVAERARDIDIGVIFGLGFPPFRGGILRHADSVGIAKIVDEMNALADTYGERLRPAKILVDMAKKNKTFYGQ